MTIETSAQWWREIEQNWDELVVLFEGCTLGEQRGDLERMRQRRDARIARRLTAAKRQAPRPRARRGHRGWRILLDLCAEQWVLHQAVA